MRVLLIEDDEQVARSIELMLKAAGFNIYTTDMGEDGVDLGKVYEYDLIVLDLGLPDISGYEVLKQLRMSRVNTPVLILSGNPDIEAKVKTLGFGADDYLTKPYHMSELLARIDALARRGESSNSETNTKLKLADLELDRMTRRVTRNGKKIELTAREFQLLEFMMRHSGQVVTRTMLLEGVWDYHFDPQTNVIDVHISRLRQAIDKDFDKPLLHTVRGAGYSLREDE